MVELSPRVRMLATLLLTTSWSVACASSGGGDGAASAPAPAPAASAPAPAPAAPAPTAPAAGAMTLADGVYSAEQAEAGSEVFSSTCSECHDTYEFRGTDFMFDWEGSTVGRFVRLVSETMPDDNPGSVPIEQVVAVAAYVLQLNNYPEGTAPLSTDLDILSELRFERPAPAPATQDGPGR